MHPDESTADRTRVAPSCSGMIAKGASWVVVATRATASHIPCHKDRVIHTNDENRDDQRYPMQILFLIPRTRNQTGCRSPERPTHATSNAVSAVAVFAAFAAMVPMLSRPAYADDPCSATDREVVKIIHSLERFNNLLSGDGVFQVRESSAPKDPASGVPPFEVSYQTKGKVLFQERIPYPSLSVADALIIKPLHAREGAKLGLAYGMGAGGKISCEYKIYDTGGRITAKRGKW